LRPKMEKRLGVGGGDEGGSEVAGYVRFERRDWDELMAGRVKL